MKNKNFRTVAWKGERESKGGGKKGRNTCGDESRTIVVVIIVFL